MDQIQSLSPSSCVLAYRLEELSKSKAKDIFIVYEDGNVWTYSHTHSLACQFGRVLIDSGLTVGDRFLVWMPNDWRALQAYFGCSAAGASFVAINTAYKGKLLEHVIENSKAASMLVHPDLLPRLIGINLGNLKRIYTDLKGGSEHAGTLSDHGIHVVDWNAFTQASADDLPVRGLHPWTEQSICYTSGTTGPSKGVLSSYLHMHTMGKECLPDLTPGDRAVVSLPLFHVGGTLFITGAMAAGSSIAFFSSFNTKTFLPLCKQMDATVCILLGTMAGYLIGQQASPSDIEHSLRLAMVVPLTQDSAVLKQRFGFDVYTLFNMSEVSSPIRSELNPSVRGACGRLRSGVEARIVDEFDCAVPTGTVGELVLRMAMPWTTSHGYNNMPDATARAWRNGWFHTGDAFRSDSEGNYFFVDRTKDAIRRRGENISSFEVESEVLSHEAVLDAAAVGIANEISEEDVLVAVVVKPDMCITPKELVDYLVPRLPHFMIPRYVRFVDVLPKTSTSKVEKHVLRHQGVTAETWDAEKHGVRFKRETFSA